MCTFEWIDLLGCQFLVQIRCQIRSSDIKGVSQVLYIFFANLKSDLFNRTCPEKRRSLQAHFFPPFWPTPASLRPRIVPAPPYRSNRITKLSQKSGRWRQWMKKKTSWKGLPLSHIGEFHNLDIPLLSRPCSKGTPIQLKVLYFLFHMVQTVQTHKCLLVLKSFALTYKTCRSSSRHYVKIANVGFA